MSRLVERVLVVAAILLIAGLLVQTSRADAYTRPAPTTVTVKHVRADSHQRRMVARVLAQCVRMDAPRKVLIAAVATATQESTMRNLRGGDRDSVGLFQIRRMHVRGRDLRRVPEWAAKWFCERAINVNFHRPHLTVGRLSQAVQRSGHPGAYRQWTREAVRTYRLVLRRP
jgi:hypothetical protein